MRVDGSEGQMSDGSADRADAVPVVSRLLRHQDAAQRRLDMSVWVDERERQDALADRRLVKGFLVGVAGLVFLLAVLGWL